MNAIREIIEVHNNRIVIELPQHFQKTKVEVIILSLDTDGDTAEKPPLLPQAKRKNYEQYFGVTHIGENTIERQLHRIRSEWERHVFS